MSGFRTFEREFMRYGKHHANRRAHAMSDFLKIVEQVTKHFTRDEARKQRIAASFSQLGFAMDAQMSEMSSRELASHVIKEKLGLKIGSNSDPLEALDYYLAGLNARGAAFGSWAADSRDSNSFIDRYLEEAKHE
jgi:hypothetical protein